MTTNHVHTFTLPAPMGHRYCPCGTVSDDSTCGVWHGRQYDDQTLPKWKRVLNRQNRLDDARKAERQAAEQKKASCPTPKKARHKTMDAAIHAAYMLNRGTGTPARPYACICGRFHVTHWSLDEYLERTQHRQDNAS